MRIRNTTTYREHHEHTYAESTDCPNARWETRSNTHGWPASLFGGDSFELPESEHFPPNSAQYRALQALLPTLSWPRCPVFTVLLVLLELEHPHLLLAASVRALHDAKVAAPRTEVVVDARRGTWKRVGEMLRSLLRKNHGRSLCLANCEHRPHGSPSVRVEVADPHRLVAALVLAPCGRRVEVAAAAAAAVVATVAVAAAVSVAGGYESVVVAAACWAQRALAPQTAVEAALLVGVNLQDLRLHPQPAQLCRVRGFRGFQASSPDQGVPWRLPLTIREDWKESALERLPPRPSQPTRVAGVRLCELRGRRGLNCPAWSTLARARTRHLAGCVSLSLSLAAVELRYGSDKLLGNGIGVALPVRRRAVIARPANPGLALHDLLTSMYDLI